MRWAGVPAAYFAGVLLFSQPVSALPVIPGAAGFGIDTPAARGGAIYRVTNLNNSGPGSLRACVEDDDSVGARYCLFEISGTIRLNSEIVSTTPNLTIAGQTAPSPGILVGDGCGVVIRANDALVQHIRVGAGDRSGTCTDGDRDSLKVSGTDGHKVANVVIDHVSVRWGDDENMAWRYAENSTIRYSTITEPLRRTDLETKGHNFTHFFTEETSNIAITFNLHSQGRRRNPIFNKQADGHVIANNIVYNPQQPADRKIAFYQISDPTDGDTLHFSVLGNLLIRGPESGSGNALVTTQDWSAGPESGTDVYVNDNRCPGGTGGECRFDGEGIMITTPSANTPVIPGFTAMDSSLIESHILAHAGARPSDRDQTEVRVIADVTNRTGRYVDNMSDLPGPDGPGYPSLAVNTRSLESLGLPTDPTGDDDGDGYTNIEEWLHQLDCDVGGNCPSGGGGT